MERLHILDGYGYIFRAHYGILYGGKGRQGVRLSTAAGFPTGALYVYSAMMTRLILDVKPERVVVVYDSPERSFREAIDPNYKANRSEMPDDLREQMPHFKPLTEAFSWPVIAVPGVEADDVIATIVTQAKARGWEVVLYSADKDLTQLIGDGVTMIDAMREKTYDRAGVIEKFGVPPELISQYLALVGDTSDNIPGVSGIGPKTAAKLLMDHGSIDGVLASVPQMKGKLAERFSDPTQLANLEISRKLVELRYDVPLPAPLESFVPYTWDGEALKAKLLEFDFDVLVKRLEGKVVQSTDAAAPEPVPMAQPPVIAGSVADVAAEIAAARAARKIAVVVECDEQRNDRARPVGIALAVPERAPLYIPVGHRYLSAPKSFTAEELAPLGELLRDESITVVTHDLKSTMKHLGRWGLPINGNARDTMIAAYLLDSSRDEFAIDTVLAKATSLPVVPRAQVVGSGKKAIPFETVAVEQAAECAGSAAAALLHGSDKLETQIAREGLLPLERDLEIPLAALLARIEEYGIAIDVPFLRKLSEEVGGDLAALEKQAYEQAGEVFNLGSPKQLAHLLFEKLALKSDRMKKKKTGYSTDYEVLDAMRELHPIIPVILQHRELMKLKGTYIDALPPLLNPRTGRLHTEFRQAVAATGRLSSVDPNLQNIPIRSDRGKDIRKAFIAPPGQLLLSADYSQIELRVLAHYSQDPTLVRAFAEDIDVHTQTAAEVFDLPLDKVGPNERRVAKAVNYGLAYGQSEFGLARALDISRTEAAEYIAKYFERFATVSKFMEELSMRARKEGVASTLLGRRRPIPEINAKNYQLRSAAERIAQNMPMQGSAADIMKLAMLRVDKAMGDRFKSRMLLTVHDELLFEVPEAELDDMKALVKREMEAAYELRVPLRVDVGVGRNWADAH